MKITYQFDEARTAEAASLLLSLEGGIMDKMRLVKLLYLSDRESLKQHLFPITGDLYYCMVHGPVLSSLLDLMKKPGDGPWSRTVSMHGKRCEQLRTWDRNESLSDSDVLILTGVSNHFSGYSTSGLRNYTHRMCPEYRETPEGSRSDLPVEAILKAVGRSPEEIEYARELAELSNSALYRAGR